MNFEQYYDSSVSENSPMIAHVFLSVYETLKEIPKILTHLGPTL